MGLAPNSRPAGPSRLPQLQGFQPPPCRHPSSALWTSEWLLVRCRLKASTPACSQERLELDLTLETQTAFPSPALMLPLVSPEQPLPRGLPAGGPAPCSARAGALGPQTALPCVRTAREPQTGTTSKCQVGSCQRLPKDRKGVPVHSRDRFPFPSWGSPHSLRLPGPPLSSPPPRCPLTPAGASPSSRACPRPQRAPPGAATNTRPRPPGGLLDPSLLVALLSAVGAGGNPWKQSSVTSWIILVGKILHLGTRLLSVIFQSPTLP